MAATGHSPAALRGHDFGRIKVHADERVTSAGHRLVPIRALPGGPVAHGLPDVALHRPPPDARFRMPAAARLHEIMTATPGLDEAEFKEALRQALGRMAEDNPLRDTGASEAELDVLMDKFFPAGEPFDRDILRERIDRLVAGEEACAELDSILATAGLTDAEVKAGFRSTLLRIGHESRLNAPVGSPADLDALVARIIPSPGVFDEDEFNKAVNVNDRTDIYENVLEASTQVKAADAGPLKAALLDAVSEMEKSEADDANLKLVFGEKKAARAKKVYKKAAHDLRQTSSRMERRISTDYNFDDPEVGLGGWASHGSKQIHLMAGVVRNPAASESKFIFIHEATHMAREDVIDRGYYGSDGFEAMSEADKVTNAAHYEEIPRRHNGASIYVVKGHLEFTPREAAELTFEERVKRDASEYLRMAWDSSVRTHQFLRNIRKETIEKGRNSTLKHKKKQVLEISRLMNLTIHQQEPGKETVTELDLVLSEGVAHAVSAALEVVKGLAVSPGWAWSTLTAHLPEVFGPDTLADQTYKGALAFRLVMDAVAASGRIIAGDFLKDALLLRYLFRHYGEEF